MCVPPIIVPIPLPTEDAYTSYIIYRWMTSDGTIYAINIAIFIAPTRSTMESKIEPEVERYET